MRDDHGMGIGRARESSRSGSSSRSNRRRSSSSGSSSEDCQAESLILFFAGACWSTRPRLGTLRTAKKGEDWWTSDAIGREYGAGSE